MPFPFYWIGALVAGLVLAGALTVFGLALDVVARATNGVRGSVLPGLVAGFREWTGDRGGAARSPAARQDPGPASPIEDAPPLDRQSMERVHPRVG